MDNIIDHAQVLAIAQLDYWTRRLIICLMSQVNFKTNYDMYIYIYTYTVLTLVLSVITDN